MTQNNTIKFDSKFSSTDKILHEQFVHYGRNVKEWTRKCVVLLPKIEKKQIWKKRGFKSLYEYAAKLAGMSRSSVDEALRILKHVEDKPELKKVVEEKGIQSVRPVAAIATRETADFWANRAREMSKNTLEVYVREYKKQFSNKNRLEILPREEFQPENPQERRAIIMPLEPKIAAELEKLKGSGDWNELMKEFLELRKQKLEKEKPATKETNSRHIPEKIKHFAYAKTHGQCGYPGCTKPCKILHHTQRWALKNIHNPDQIVPLCLAHERLAHHGLIDNEEQTTDKWKILTEPVWWNAKRLVDQTVVRHRKFA